MIYTHKDCLLLHKKRLKNVFSYVTYFIYVRLICFPHASLFRDCIKTSQMNQTTVVAYLTQLNWMASLTSLLCHHDMKLGIRIPLSLSTVDPLVLKSKHLIRHCVWGKIFYLVYIISHQSLIFSSHSVWSMLPRKIQTNYLNKII